MMRLDKYLAERTGMTRSESRKAVTKGRVSIDGAVCRKADTQLDEHTAALDPKTAAKVLDTTEKIVQRDKLTTLMITHNMRDAILHGNRLIMMHEGKIIYDVSGEEKKNLKVADLLAKFEEVSGGEFANDRMMLS